jgi:CCR4-NOT transcription complex subunit 1
MVAFFCFRIVLDEVLLSVGVAENSELKQDVLYTIFKYCVDRMYFSTWFWEALRTVSVSDVPSNIVK